MKSTRYFALFIVSFLFAVTVSIAQTPAYSRVKIYADENGLKQLAKAGVAFDHGEYKKGVYFISDFSADEIAIMQKMGTKYDVLISDVSKYYVDQNKAGAAEKTTAAVSNVCSNVPVFPTPANFALGSMGGFFTYQEIIANIDTMLQKFPNLISAKAAISTTQTIEGRDIYWVRISNNPNVDQNKPQVLYTALHHAREPASASQVIMYMYYLLENYNTDPEVKYLVDNLEMYFIPCINPDGYIYNQTTNPNGGGLFRKNRRNNGDGTYGVDLNRNYGLNWGYDNYGSSNQTNNDAYRGTSAFSEPETRAMKDFCNAHKFKLAINYHTYSNDLIYPWGYGTSLLTPDSTTYKAYAEVMTQENGYGIGTPDQTVGYTANGGSDDWMYGDVSAKPKVYAMSAEAGSSADGFWPAQNRIVAVCKENLAQNIHMAQLATKYAVAKDISSKVVSQLSNYEIYNLQRLGLDSPATYVVSLIPVTSNITSVGNSNSYSSLKLLETVSDSISYSLSSSVVNGDKVVFVLSVDNGAYLINDTITKIYGTPIVAYATNANSLSGWTTTKWGTSTTVYHSPSASITDSPVGNYANNSNTSITLSSTVDLTDAVYAQMEFWARWEIEATFDYVEVNASSDNGSTWTPLCGKYTHAGDDNQDPGNPIYDGYQYTWLKESMDLSNFIGTNVLVKFTLVSDPGVNYDGFYFDDLDIVKVVPSLTGIKKIDAVTSSTVFPNPFTGKTTVNYKGKTTGTLNFVVYNMLGELVASKDIAGSSGSFEFDGASLSPGVYYYKIISEEGFSSGGKMTITQR